MRAAPKTWLSPGFAAVLLTAMETAKFVALDDAAAW